jgi:uncharacterized repeat protein (TIGR02543 family)
MRDHTIRKLWIFLILALSLLFIIPQSNSYVLEPSSSLPRYVEQELLLQISNESEATQIANELDLNIISVSSYGVAVFRTKSEEQFNTLLKVSPYNFSINGIAVSEAPPFRTSEDLSKLYALNLMDTIEAWTLTTGSADVLVAVIDTGIDTSHTEFVGRLSSISYNSKTKRVGLSNVVDDDGHGTMVAGVIAANKGNNVGIAGIAPSVQLLIIKANDPNEGVFADSSVIEAIYYAANHGADVINLSLGGEYANPLTKTALEYAISLGIIVVAAAGNSSSNAPMYPAAFDTTISVSAIDNLKMIASYSNYGSTITLAAPGTNIYTTLQGGLYGYASGTSLAAPQISGVLALMFSYLPNDRELILDRLLKTSEDAGAFGKDIYYGYGIVNTYDALVHPLVNIDLQTNGGTLMSSIKVASGRTFSISIQPTKDGAVFEGWYKDAGLTQVWIEGIDSTETDITLYAKFTNNFHHITFVTSGTPVNPMVVANGNSIPLPNSFKEHHELNGWYYDANYQTKYVGEAVYSDLTLYALFIENETFYNVMFVTEGSSIDPIRVAEGDAIDPPPSGLTGYTFVGWYIDNHYEVAYSGEPVYNHLTLYARFEINLYTIRFFSGEDELDSLQAPYDAEISLPTALKVGHTFDGWYLDSEFVQSYIVEPVENDFILYAKFIPIDYTVTFVTDGDPIESIQVSYGSTFTPPIPLKDSFRFSGWYLDSEYHTLYEVSLIIGDITLYALFSDVPYYLITFYQDDLAVTFLEVMEGETFTLPIVSKTGHSFVGWYTTIDLSTEYVLSLVDGPLNLFAKFSPNQFTVTFLDANLEILTQTTVSYGQGVVAPTPPTKASSSSFHYLFHSWSDGLEFIDANLTLTPIFTKEFIPTSVELLLGVDTIYLATTWVDGGVSLLDQTLEVVVNADNLSISVGRYIITYSIMEDDVVWYTLLRIINVVEPLPEIKITLLPNLTTISVGSLYEDSGATTNIGTIITTNTVDASTVGTYLITYSVTINQFTVIKHKIVTVIEPDVQTKTPVFTVEKKKDWWVEL